jgi:hypothetical protein
VAFGVHFFFDFVEHLEGSFVYLNGCRQL